MDNEKDLLKQDLSKLEKKEEIEKFVEDAELLGHEDIAKLGREKIDSLSKKAESVSGTSPSQVEQVEKLGGSKDVVDEKTKEIDQKIEEVKEDSTTKINEVQKQDQEKTSEKSENKENILQELSGKLEEAHREARQEYDNFIAERIKNYNELVVEAHKTIEKGESGSLDEMIKLVEDYSQNGFSDLVRRLRNVKPYENNIRHPQIQEIDTKVHSQYQEKINKLKEEAEKQKIELPRERSLIDTEDKLFHDLIDIDKKETPFMESLGQKKKEVEEKIKTQANEIMANKMKELEKLEQDYKNMPEHKELIELEKQSDDLWKKKTGVFFSEKKKEEQKKEIFNKIDETKNKIRAFLRPREEIGNSLRDFGDKFKFNQHLLNQEKYSALWTKLNSI